MKKNTIYTVIAVVLAVVTLTVGVLLILKNIGEPEVSIGSAKGLVGDFVEVPVKIENNPGIWGAQIIVEYDSKFLTFDSFSAGTVFEQCEANGADGNVAVLATHSVTKDGLKNTSDDGTIITLKFKIKVTATDGEQELKFNSDTNFCDANDTLIDVKFNNGYITVK